MRPSRKHRSKLKSFPTFIKNIQMKNNSCYPFLIFLVLFLVGCENTQTKTEVLAVGFSPTKAKSLDDKFISWKEHIIDDTSLSGISGSDGLSIGDLDQDGYIDIVSVHETDTEYKEDAEGFIRIAFGSADPHVWESVSLAQGTKVGGAEDVAIVDLNSDGFLDIVGACEWAHLIYFENPGTDCRTKKWKRHIPSVTKNNGAYIRVFEADLNRDGKFELVAANKGLSDGLKDTPQEKIFPISYFEIQGDPLDDISWIQHELIRVKVPINSQPVDLDLDGDLDIIAGSRGEGKVYFLENISTDKIKFKTHLIQPKGSSMAGRTEAVINAFNIDFVDYSNDGLLDIVLFEVNKADKALGTHLIWLEQPTSFDQAWKVHTIGNTYPDELVGIRKADINADGHMDIMTGGYSRGARDKDGKVKKDQSLGRIAWFEHPKDLAKPWVRHDISRRVRGMFDKFIARDMDDDGDIDFISTRGNSNPYDGVFWLEQIRTAEPRNSFKAARSSESREEGLE